MIDQRYDFGVQTYTTPKFEDKTRAAVIREGDKQWEKIKELRKQINAAMETLDHWNHLQDELIAARAEKISQLPPERVEHWKALLEERFQSYI